MTTPAPTPSIWLVAGTIPEADFPLTLAPCRLHGDAAMRLSFQVPGKPGCLETAVNRGTPALLAAAALTAQIMASPAERPEIWALVAGDTGRGHGSRGVYARLGEAAEELGPRGVTFHYLLPDVDWHGKILAALQALENPPLLVADAGFMYAAKMSGYAAEYDLFTPDIGELAFLADPDAPHPFYTRNFLLADEGMAEELIAKAYAHGNAAQHLLVKGKADRFVANGAILDAVTTPDVPMLEPVGGTGDTVTGIATALLAMGLPMRHACVTAMRANRAMGELAAPTPESSVADLLRFLPEALGRITERGDCSTAVELPVP